MQSIQNSCYFGGDALTCLLNQLVSAFGGPGLFGFIGAGVIFAVFWIAAEGDMAVPTVALILTGTVFVPMLPGSHSQMAIGVVTIGLAAAIWQVAKQYVLPGSVR